MRALSVLAVLLGMLAGLATASVADSELGKTVYTKQCVSCHGADGKGNAKMAAMLKTTIPPLAGSAAKADADLVKMVAEGKKPMPAFGKKLSNEELEAVVHYVKTLAGQ